MRNNIVFKFLAIVLCAASLLGAVAGVGGTIVLTAGNLYNRTVDQMLEEMQQEDAMDFARWLARSYASTELGGCSEDMVESWYGSHQITYRYQRYGYTIFDAQGTELLSQNPEYKSGAPFLQSYSPDGKYMHLVSLESESQRQAQETASRMENYGMKPVESLQGTVLPEEGAGVTHAVFTGVNGGLLLEAYFDGGTTILTYNGADSALSIDVPTGNYVGHLYYDRENRLVFRGTFDLREFSSTEITETMIGSVYFFSPGSDVYIALSRDSGVGTLASRDGSVLFHTLEAVVAEEALPEETQAETVPETTGATVPESIPETVPETAPQEVTEATAPAAETLPPETVTEETSAPSAVPEATAAPAVETQPPQTQETVSQEATAATVPETQPPQTEAVTEPTPSEPAPSEPMLINGKRLEEYQVNHTRFRNRESGEWMEAQFVYLPMPELTVEVFFPEGAMRQESVYTLLRVVRMYRDYLMPLAIGCLAVFAVLFVYLCTAAGRKPKSDEVQAGGLNRMPLDLYLGFGALAVGCIIALAAASIEGLCEANLPMACLALAASGYLCCLIFVGFCFAFVAQLKTPDGYWIRNTLCCRFIFLWMWAAKWLLDNGMPWIGRILHWSWKEILKAMIWLYKLTEAGMLWSAKALGRMFRAVGRRMERFFSLLPLIWQWLLAGLVALLCFLFVLTGNLFGMLLGILIPVSILIYAAESFGTLAQSTRRMSKGDLDTKVDDSKLIGCFRESAEDLNALADVAVVAAQKQLKSERMKTELITNVSHDIKTPLTSIINYVDLLQKPHTPEEQAQYLEVLDRQSQRLKKLIDDLMDMSKASTGNMTVEITQVDAVESVNQALGEFADKLNRAQLTPVFRYSGDSIPMMADGRLVWRVLSNLLGNAVKYALPGTRMYIDLQSVEGKVILSLKNISREELNVEAAELMERFVRGDDSRNTEGSGLGLNIAKSLMELQKGQLQLLVDGDLFKVTLVFPGV